MYKGDISNITSKATAWDSGLLFNVKYPKMLVLGTRLKIKWLINNSISINYLALREFIKECSNGNTIFIYTKDINVFLYLQYSGEYPIIYASPNVLEENNITTVYTNDVRDYIADPIHFRFIEQYKDKIKANNPMKKLLLSSIELLIKRGWIS